MHEYLSMQEVCHFSDSINRYFSYPNGGEITWQRRKAQRKSNLVEVKIMANVGYDDDYDYDFDDYEDD